MQFHDKKTACRTIFIVWLSLCFAVVLMAPQSSVAQIQPNTWVEVFPTTTYPPGRNGQPQARSWYGGITYRPASNSLVFYDGYIGEEATNSIYANTMTSWDFTNNKLTVLKITDVTPMRRHTYEFFTYVPAQDKLYMAKGANGTESSGCGADGLIWRFRFSDNTWEQVLNSNLPTTTYGCEGKVLYWAAQNKLIYIDGWGTQTSEFVPGGAEQWVAVSVTKTNMPGDLFPYRYGTTWDSARKLWVFHHSGNFVRYDPVAHTYTGILPGGTKPPVVGTEGLCYLPIYDAYLVAGGASGTFSDTVQTWIYKNATGTWTQVTSADIPWGTSETRDHRMTYLYYDQPTNTIYMLASGRRFFKMQYSEGGLSPAAPSALLVQ